MKKTTTISVRFSDDEIKEIDIQADILNVNRSEYVRFAVKSACENKLIPKKQVNKLIHKITYILDTASKKTLSDDIRKELRQWN